jgi:tetratricopeptide (TPR) repeat protein
MTFRFQTGKFSELLRQRGLAYAVVAGVSMAASLATDNHPPSNQRLYPAGTLSLATFTNQPANPEEGAAPPVTPPHDIHSSNSLRIGQETALHNTQSVIAKSPAGDAGPPPEEAALIQLSKKLELARHLRTIRQPLDAEPLLIQLLAESSPVSIQQSALLELAAAAQDENELARAQQIFAQFLAKWGDDLRVPEILLRQGFLYRQMGLNNLALTKFYSVMTSALVLKNDRMEYYARLVQQAQTEIAETHYALGKYAEAADFFSRLLKQTNSIGKTQILYKLTRCHAALGKHAEAVSDATDFLAHYATAPEQPEIRFHLAVSLKHLGRNNESLQQVLALLQEQRDVTKDRPEVWAQWQQRAGNLIANHLYSEGDYPKALEVYLNLAQLDSALTWRLPVIYQIGMTYERLWQPQKAVETYAEILKHEKELGTDVPTGLKTVFEMARWRSRFIEWQTSAESASRPFRASTQTNAAVTASLLTPSGPMP